MATTNNKLVLATLTALAAAPYCYYRYQRYLKERQASRWLSGFGKHVNDVEDCLVDPAPADPEAGLGDELPKPHIRGWRRNPTNVRNKLAFVSADEAYLQFGRRERSQANDLVTRKFLRDFLREKQGLRAKDLSAIIEVALPLSYVPPPVYKDVRELTETDAYAAEVKVGTSKYF